MTSNFKFGDFISNNMCFWSLLIAVSKSTFFVMYDEYSDDIRIKQSEIDKSNDLFSKIQYFQDEHRYR